jgi:hypothetical protein
LVLEHLPLGIEGSKIDDRLALGILCCASVKRISIESACMELAGASSGKSKREHLYAALEPSREGIRELEARLNQALKAQLLKRVCRPIEKRRIERAADWVGIPLTGKRLRMTMKCGVARPRAARPPFIDTPPGRWFTADNASP